jgi:hypothetical protein
MDYTMRTVPGTVNLIAHQGLRLAGNKQDGTIRDCLEGLGGLGSHLHARYRVPDREPFLQDRTVVFCGQAMTAWAKVVTNQTMCSQKSLRMTW